MKIEERGIKLGLWDQGKTNSQEWQLAEIEPVFFSVVAGGNNENLTVLARESLDKVYDHILTILINFYYNLFSSISLV